VPDEGAGEAAASLAAAMADRYRIERELGQGGMATVYLAHDVRHDRKVALKVLRPELAAVIGAERFLAEIRTTANLQHPHILPLFDSGSADHFLYYVMPYVQGESLRDRLSRDKQLSVDEAVRIATEVAGALDYAHRHGVVHRDIKPENILLHEGQALVADFGIALAVSRIGASRLTETGMSLGTPAYMAPEQAMGEREITPRADVYALGCVLYEMLLGEPPFTGPTAQAILAQVITSKPESIVTRRERVPAHVEEAVFTALEKLPADRFATAAQFVEALHAAGTAGAAPGRPGAPRADRARAVVRVWQLAVGAAALAAGAFALGRLSGGGVSPLRRFGRAIKVTYDPGLEIQPAVSPDGRLVAYAAGTSATLRIFVRQVAGGRPIALTGDTDEVESAPTWSPDGSRVLFLARGGVFSAASSGGDARPEIPAPAGAWIASAAWAPDGSTIAYVVGDSLLLWVNQRPGRLVGRIHEPSLCRWSPDGRLIACASGNAWYLEAGPKLANLAPSRIVVIRVADGATAPVTDSLSLNHSPAWSSDGRWLHFVSDRDGPRDVYAVRISTSGHASGPAIRLTTGLGAQSVSLSADGRRMAYAVLTATANIWSLPFPTHPPVSSRGAIQVSSADQMVEDPTASRDGKWLVYASNLTGQSQIYRVATTGGTPERLTADAYDDFSPALSPDDRALAFHSVRSGSRDVYVQPLDGSALQQVTSSPAEEAAPQWSPDGRELAFMHLNPPGGIWVVHRQPDRGWGAPVERTSAGYLPTWSPDGRRVVFVSSIEGGTISIMPADSGPPHRVPGPPGVAQQAQFALWSADGRAIYFKTNDAQGNAFLWAIPAAGGTPTLLVRFDEPDRPFYRPIFAVAGSRLFFTVDNRQADVYVMDLERR